MCEIAQEWIPVPVSIERLSLTEISEMLPRCQIDEMLRVEFPWYEGELALKGTFIRLMRDAFALGVKTARAMTESVIVPAEDS